MSDLAYPQGWLRGVLDPLLLALLAEGEAYGYELAGRLEECGFGRIPGGSLYPALLRLQRQELLDAQWRAGEGGPGRKYYALTEEGRRTLVDQAGSWETFSSNVSAVLTAGARK